MKIYTVFAMRYFAMFALFDVFAMFAYVASLVLLLCYNVAKLVIATLFASLLFLLFCQCNRAFRTSEVCCCGMLLLLCYVAMLH